MRNSVIKYLKRVLFWVARGVCAGALLTGCTGYSITGGPGQTVSPRLRSEAKSPRDLLSVNTVLVAPVLLDEQVQREAQTNEAFYSSLVHAVRQELSLEVVAGRSVLERFPTESPAGLGMNAVEKVAEGLQFVELATCR